MRHCDFEYQKIQRRHVEICLKFCLKTFCLNFCRKLRHFVLSSPYLRQNVLSYENLRQNLRQNFSVPSGDFSFSEKNWLSGATQVFVEFVGGRGCSRYLLPVVYLHRIGRVLAHMYERILRNYANLLDHHVHTCTWYTSSVSRLSP